MAPASRSPKRRRRSDKRRSAEHRRKRAARRAAERRREFDRRRPAGAGHRGERDAPRATGRRREHERRRAMAVLAGCVALLLLLGLGVYLLGDWESPPDEWRVTGFDAQVTVHASGSVDMVETVTYDFGDRPSHGLTRELPETGWIDDYGWRDFGLTDVRAQSADGLPVEISPGEGDPRAESRTVVRVGDFGADPELTGEHVFEIAYTYERLTTPGADGGARYYADIVGSGWSVPVESATAAFHLPDLADLPDPDESEEAYDAIDAACHAGDVGDRG
ncbi:DUF2207 domain-containing protein, partial [Nocardiopsis lucentensis]|uniref:DUF2207 domain-containing protein n=1 Tax=Nocardiopsis lucentensis TaxID=53441 RepID=UPI001378E581